jgi:hypothetical protein
MLRSIEIIKEQIKLIHKDERDQEIKELRELIEFINLDREILLSENQRLSKLTEEGSWKSRFFTAKEELLLEKSKKKELEKRIEELEDIINSSLTDRSTMDIGSYTDRPSDYFSIIHHSEDPSSSASKPLSLKSITHSSPTKIHSPPKPPRGEPKPPQKSPGKASIQIKSNLAKAIAEAHKTLYSTVHHRQRSSSPSLSSGASRYSTPPKGLLSLSVTSNN